MKTNIHRAALAAAVLATIPSMAMAIVTNLGSASREYPIYTTGATALGAFTSAQGIRGPYLVGTSGGVRIGNSLYTIDTSAPFTLGQAFGIQNKSAVDPAIEPALTDDRAVYMYHQTGSINGIREMARAQGLLAVTPFTVSTNNPLFVQGTQVFALGGASGNGYAVPAAYNPVIAYSDVRAVQGFAVPGASAAPNKIPGQTGYGFGTPKTKGNAAAGPVFQALTSLAVLDDPTDAYAAGVTTLNNRVRNESLATVAFTVSANPGTGLDSVSESDVRFLQAAGRLANGANFNFAARDIGSGTRNQAANNVNLDPSWAGGERDRFALASTATQDINGNNVVLSVGQETNPEFNLNGSAGAAGGVGVNNNEHRPSAIARFADKTAGGRAVRSVLLTNRMSLGVLSAGDVGGRGRSVTASDALRVLAIDFDEAPGQAGEPVTGPVQPNAVNVTTGRYQMWSSAQAITAVPTDGSGFAVAGNSIKGDYDDVSNATSGATTGLGIHRKFLNNINNSVASGPIGNTTGTPFDNLIAQTFIPGTLMLVDKAFDGGTQTRNADANTVEASSFYQTYVNSPGTSGTLGASLNWARAGDVTGPVAGQLYRVYDVNTNTGGQVPAADLQISLNTNTFLMGDFNRDSVRDLRDVQRLAQAIAKTDDYVTWAGAQAIPLTTTTTPAAASGNLNTSGLVGPNAAITQGRTALLAISDLNGDGNVIPVNGAGQDVTLAPDYSNAGAFLAALGSGAGNNADRVVPISRDDVRFFLYGAAVDTSPSAPTYDGATTLATIYNDPALLRGRAAGDTAANRRELGVRYGLLKKNAAIATFNAELDAMVGAGFTQAQADALKFDAKDVNGDGSVNTKDLLIVGRLAQANGQAGSKVWSLDDQFAPAAQLNAYVAGPEGSRQISLIDAELTDDAKVTWADAKLLRQFKGDFGGDSDPLGGFNSPDGAFDNFDIDAFLLALSSSSEYLALNPGLVSADLITLGDFGGGVDTLGGFNSPDGSFDNFDIDAFLFALSDPTGYEAVQPAARPGPAGAIPEPAALGLLAPAALLLGRRRR